MPSLVIKRNASSYFDFYGARVCEAADKLDAALSALGGRVMGVFQALYNMCTTFMWSFIIRRAP